MVPSSGTMALCFLRNGRGWVGFKIECWGWIWRSLVFPSFSQVHSRRQAKEREEDGPSASLHMGASSSLLLSLVPQDVDSHLILSITPSGTWTSTSSRKNVHQTPKPYQRLSLCNAFLVEQWQPTGSHLSYVHADLHGPSYMLPYNSLVSPAPSNFRTDGRVILNQLSSVTLLTVYVILSCLQEKGRS